MLVQHIVTVMNSLHFHEKRENINQKKKTTKEESLLDKGEDKLKQNHLWQLQKSDLQFYQGLTWDIIPLVILVIRSNHL